MNSLFSYDSKLMQILMKVGDLMILNFCFILCGLFFPFLVAYASLGLKLMPFNSALFWILLVISLFAVGAAQAGLYNGAKVMQDPDDDSPVYKAFFKGFSNGIGSITLAWLIVEILLSVLVYVCIIALYRGSPLWILIVAIAAFGQFTCLIPVIHARFNCKWWQLISNAFLISMAHPIRTFGVLALTWLPAVLFLNYTYYFMMVAPIWFTLYFSTAHLFAYQFMRKPMEGLIADYKKSHGETDEETESEAEDEPITVIEE